MSVGVMGGASSNQNSTDASGNPGGDTRHWRYEEFGTEHQPAHPIMRPALANNVDRVTATFTDSLNASIDKIIAGQNRSEEHTSELQSLMRITYAVFCLTKKKTNKSTLQKIT